jgi:hypothetical protein
LNLAQTSVDTDNEVDEKLFETHHAFAAAWEEGEKY